MKAGGESWKRELLFTGDIVQDDDDSVDWPERERRFTRYLELVEAVDGTEGAEAAAAIIQSFQAKNDYGAYQTAHRVLGRFPTDVFMTAFIQELPALIKRQPDWAGELLCAMANGVGTQFEPEIADFRAHLNRATEEIRGPINQYIVQQEQTGWLSHRRGVLS